jgi:heme exporter protein C
MRGALPTLLVAITAIAFGISVPFVFLNTPTAQLAAGGLAQKIFYFHVPAAIAMYVGGTVCFGASIAYLLRDTDERDALARAGAEIAVLFGALVLASGPLWAKKAWGVYWTWDPRLTTALLSWAIYVAIVVLRQFAGEGSAERRFAAAIGVLGWFNLWLVHLSVQLWGGNHPTVVGRGGGGLGDPRMGQALGLGFLTTLLLTAVLVWLRTRLHVTEARLERAEQDALASSPENT